MLRFSIREILLLTLTVACLAGWWKYYLVIRAEQARLSQETKQLRVMLGESERQIYATERLNHLSVQLQSNRTELRSLQTESEKARLEADNKRLQAESSQLKTQNERLRRRLLHHDTQSDILIERFLRDRPGS